MHAVFAAIDESFLFPYSTSVEDCVVDGPVTRGQENFFVNGAVGQNSDDVIVGERGGVGGHDGAPPLVVRGEVDDIHLFGWFSRVRFVCFYVRSPSSRFPPNLG